MKINDLQQGSLVQFHKSSVGVEVDCFTLLEWRRVRKLESSCIHAASL